MADDISPLMPMLSAFSPDTPIKWTRLQGGDDFGYPIDYWIAPLGVQKEAGRVDFLVKWAPNAYCHYHRHTGHTTVLVLEGEHHVIEQTSPTETVHKIRKPGHLVRNPPGDVHMEHAGPNGSVLFFSMHTADGQLFDILDKNENLLRKFTLDDFANVNF